MSRLTGLQKERFWQILYTTKDLFKIMFWKALMLTKAAFICYKTLETVIIEKYYNLKEL